MLLSTDREAEVRVAALAVDEDGLHALVGLGAVGATLGLLPTILFKDARLGVREEERAAAVRTGEVRARGLRRLLGVAAVRTTDGLGPAVLGEERLITTREGEGAGAVAARELHVLGQRRTVAPGLLVAVATRTPCSLGLLGLLCSSLCLGVGLFLGHLLLELGDALVSTCQEFTHLLRVLAHRETVESVVAVGLGPHELLAIDERHVERLIGNWWEMCWT